MGNLPPPIPLDNGHALSIVICAIIFPVIATLCVIGRVASRRMKKQQLGADDYVVMVALLAVYAQMVIIIMSAVYGGVGHHIDELSAENLVIFFKLITAVQFSFGTSLGLAKISLCCLLIRIFFVKSFKIAAWVVMAYSFCWWVMVISIGAGLCRPFNFNWDKNIKNGHCGNLDAAYISIAALDIVGDTMIILLPMPWVWKLKLPPMAKLGLSFVFALGFLDIIIAILRIVYLVNTSFAPGKDFTWASTGTYVWSVIEPSMAVIVACAGLLRPLFIMVFPGFNGPFSTKGGATAASNHSFFRGTKRSQGMRYARHPDKVMNSGSFNTDIGPIGDAESDTYPLEPIKGEGGVSIYPGKRNADEENQYRGTVIAEGGALQKESSEYVRKTLDPRIINVENSYTITSTPKR